MYLSTESISHLHTLFINILHFVIMYKQPFYFDAYSKAALLWNPQGNRKTEK